MHIKCGITKKGDNRVDYRKFAIDELQHIGELRAAERICRDRLLELRESLNSIKSPATQTDPVQGGGSRTEERWLNIIAAQMDEEKRLRNVRRRIKRFDVAWAVLSERDQLVLAVWYIEGGNACAERIASREHCDRATAYRWRDDALLSFSRAFYGAIVD